MCIKRIIRIKKRQGLYISPSQKGQKVMLYKPTTQNDQKSREAISSLLIIANCILFHFLSRYFIYIHHDYNRMNYKRVPRYSKHVNAINSLRLSVIILNLFYHIKVDCPGVIKVDCPRVSRRNSWR